MAKAIVIDASAWLAVLLNEEGSEAIETLLEHHTLLAPELVRYEAANGLLYATRSQRPGLQKKHTLKAELEIVRDFPIQTIPLDAWWDESVHFVQRYRLSFYDAAYLGAATALKIPLLTLDTEILKIIRSEKLETVLPVH